MASGQWAVVLRHVQRLFHGESVSGLSEGQILDRFIATRDEVAFGAIVARHGPMVLGVCRGVLDDPHDVEDAFQATFLILVKKAAALRDRDLLGQWLYGVARRVSLRSRADSSRRKVKERPGLEAAEPVATLDADLRELQALIREEVDRLSSNDRMAVVLCYLEGLTHEEAADRLGWPVGTVKGRLSRAREKLRGRLTRRGVALPAAAIASTLARGASAAVPLELLRSTTLAATRLAAGKTLTAGLVSAHAIALMEGVIGTMFTTKLKIGATALVAACVIAVPGVMAFQGFGPAEKVGKLTSRTPKPSPDAARPDVAEREVGKAEAGPGESADPQLTSVDSAVSYKALTYINDLVAKGEEPPSSERLYTWSRRLAEAQSGPGVSDADRKAALEAHLGRMQKAQASARSGKLTEVDVLESTYRVIEAERWFRDGKVGSLGQDQRATGGGFSATGTMGGMAGNFSGNMGGMGGGLNGGMARMGGGLGGGMGGMGKAAGFPGGMGGMGRPNGMLAPGILTLNQTPADEKRNEVIRAKLEAKISMNFPNPTPFEDIKKYVEQSTQDEAAGLPTGIPIYVDPEGLELTEQKMSSTITMNLEGIPLRTTLRLAVRQLGLDYRIDGGVLLISDQESIVVQEIKAARAGVMAK